MYIIVIPLDNGGESFYKLGWAGKLPRTLNRHLATNYLREEVAVSRAKNLSVKHPDKEFKIELY